MYPIICKDQRKSQRIPAQLTLVATLNGRLLGMQSENISLDGMFIYCKEFVRPCAGFFAQVWLPYRTAALQVYLTSCFTEQTWTGYRLGVHISGISSQDRAAWEAYYHHCQNAQTEKLRQQDPVEKAPQAHRLLAIREVLGPLTRQALRKQGFIVMQVETVRQAIEMVQSLPIAAVFSEVRSPQGDGLALCHAVTSGGLPTRAVLLTDSDMPKEFLLGLFAGATRVLAKSSSPELLVSCILDVLRTPLAHAVRATTSGQDGGRCAA